MTLNELLSELAKDAENIGVPAPTRRQIGDWVDEDLIPPANRKGRGRGVGVTWHYSEESIRRAKLIIKLKARGNIRYSALRYWLFMNGEDIEETQLKAAFASEINRAVKMFWRGKTPPKDRESSNPEDIEIKHKEVVRLGPLDRRFEDAGFKLPPEQLLKTASQVFYSALETQSGKTTIVESASSILGIDLSRMDISSLEGLLAFVDEIGNRGINVIKKATLQELKASREIRNSLINSAPQILEGLSQLGVEINSEIEVAFNLWAASLKSDLWTIVLFPIFVELTKKYEKKLDH